MKPTVGRIVHFFERDLQHPDKKIVPRAAIITAVVGDIGMPTYVLNSLTSKLRRTKEEIEGAVLLTLFLPGSMKEIAEPVFQGNERGEWNWPMHVVDVAEEVILNETPESQLEVYKKRMSALMVDVMSDDFEESLRDLQYQVITLLEDHPKLKTEETLSFFKIQHSKN